MVASYLAPTKSSTNRQEEVRPTTSSSQPIARVLDLGALAYAAHGASIIGVQAHANTKYKVSQQLRVSVFALYYPHSHWLSTLPYIF